MLEYIKERLPAADDYTLEQIYDFLQEVEYQEVIHISNTEIRGLTAEQKKQQIIMALDEMSMDILDCVYKIVFYFASGIE